MDGSARLRQFLMSRAPPNKAKVAVIAEEDENEEENSSSSSSASSDSDASEEFDVNAERHHSVDDEETAGLQKGNGAEENKVADNNSHMKTTTIPDADRVPRESETPAVLSARDKPNVSTQRWKAAPLEHIEPHGFFHVFSKAQRTVDANKRTAGTSVHPAYSVSATSSSARYAEAYREDSKVSWGDSPVRTIKQLPPLSQRDSTAVSKKQSGSDNALTPVGNKAAGDIEMGLGSSVRTKLPPINGKPESSSSSSSSAIPAAASDTPSPATLASATGATKVILSPSRTIGKSLPRPHHAASSPSQSHEEKKALAKEKEEDSGQVKQSHSHHTHSRNTDAVAKAATPTLALAEDSSGKQIKSPMQAPSPVPSQIHKTSGNSPSGAPQQGRGSNITVTNGEEEEESVPIVDVFFLSWPELYIESVQSLIMILALYYSLYFTNFIAAAGSVEWCFITLAPAVLSSLLLVYIIKCAVMLSAIHAVDCDAILEVLEQTEGARALSALMREKVMALLNEMGDDPEVELYNLFAEVDSDHSGAIRYLCAM